VNTNFFFIFAIFSIIYYNIFIRSRKRNKRERKFGVCICEFRIYYFYKYILKKNIECRQARFLIIKILHMAVLHRDAGVSRMFRKCLILCLKTLKLTVPRLISTKNALKNYWPASNFFAARICRVYRQQYGSWSVL
jgi:hypothetical protein